MKKVFSLVLALALVSVITLGSTGTASAKGKDKQPIDIEATLVVMGFDVFDTNKLSGWSTIDGETLAGVGLINVIEGPAELEGLYLTGEQSSHEKFTNPILPFANVSKGKSKGTFYMSDESGTQVVGKYQLKLSSIPASGEFPGCQIYGEGKWKSKAKNSIIDGKGDINVCTNWVWLGVDLVTDEPYGTFFTQVSVTGSATLLD